MGPSYTSWETSGKSLCFLDFSFLICEMGMIIITEWENALYIAQEPNDDHHPWEVTTTMGEINESINGIEDHSICGLRFKIKTSFVQGTHARAAQVLTTDS